MPIELEVIRWKDIVSKSSSLKREKLMSLFRKKMVFLPEDEPMTNMIRLKQDKSPIIPSNIKKEKSEIEEKMYFT